MTRIVSGFAGSLTLRVPKNGTRPTSDRVREAIFSALDARDAITGLRVLDLYAGSGALGLEAASRGARVVTLVEKNQQAATLCRANASAVAKAAPRTSAPQITVSGQSVQGFLDSTSAGFDLVFIDPPYELSAEELAENLRALAPLLHEEAIVMIERSSRSPEPEWPSGLELDRRKDYGDTTLWWAHAAEAQPDA
ncbi:16S rRNA (guanine(966)-N(2))-methyltransferase RsmD [Leifsonia sp. Root4]|uniref:16S rRNA (guanine(966)-N(2))-methyltransferase RsmD n=1 Tax=Leifsonia sp. Root4 TaxID=1736525 RepID=UPI0006F841DA|nr:16S rRNA (guanine(966)-N(2))-methyltransferase RsmD [Leifsonia sp. Root4]KQW07513.1 16S rRNA (guanine(966)-N(2))-methyltransferase RsmD [Leifsonia sp. Root4]